MLQIRTVTMLAARDNGVNTCNLREMGVNHINNGNRGGFMPDEGEIISNKRVGGVDRWVLCHLRFALVVVGKDEGGRQGVECVGLPLCPR